MSSQRLDHEGLDHPGSPAYTSPSPRYDFRPVPHFSSPSYEPQLQNHPNSTSTQSSDSQCSNLISNAASIAADGFPLPLQAHEELMKRRETQRAIHSDSEDNGHFEGSLAEKQAHHGTWKEFTKSGGARVPVTINSLPDVALLNIFDFYLGDPDYMDHLADRYKDSAEKGFTAWHALVHVCQKWRNIVFGSPLRLDLRLYCIPHRTSVMEKMNAWPVFPIIVWDDCNRVRDNKMWADNIAAVFEHTGRICQLILVQIQSWQLEKVLAEMQQPFPALTRLSLRSKRGEKAPVIPDSFLGGSAPQLQFLTLQSITFPGLPKLLLSATHLVYLDLWDIPHSGYIPPETMVACLSVLTRLKNLCLRFESPQSCPNRNSRRPSPPTRTLLPILTTLYFRGVGEYLEDLVARVDAPLLNFLKIIFFHQLIFDTPQLTRFISRCAPRFKTLDKACLDFFNISHSHGGTPSVVFYAQEPLNEQLIFGIPSNQSDWLLSFATQICSLSIPQGHISTVEHLYIEESNIDWDGPPWQDDIEGSQWLELFQPFTGVKALYISEGFTPHIAPALKILVGERVMEVLPALQTLVLRDLFSPVQDTIEQFVAARQLSGHPVSISRWRREYDSDEEEVKSDKEKVKSTDDN